MGAYGFVGAGEIAAAVVEGLSEGVDDPPPVFLSPRGRDVGRELARRFPNVQVCGSNQEVVERASAVVIAVRPRQAHGVLAELAFDERHLVISAVAGVQLEQLYGCVAPARRVVRSIPLPQAARRASLTAMYPEDAGARGLFERVGSVLVPDGEPALEAVSAASGTFAAHLDYLNTISGWLAEQGLDRESATAYTTYVFGQLGRSLLQRPDALAVLTERHGTPGGSNEQLVRELRGGGVPGMVRDALDGLLARLRGAEA